MTQPEQPLPVPAPTPSGILPTPAAIGAEPAINRTGATAGTVLGYDGTNLTLGAPVAPGPAYNLTPQNLKRLRRGLGNVRSGSGPAKLFCLGDSTTAGSGATPQTSYPTLLAKQLTAAGIPAVQTWTNMAGATDPRFTKTGTGPFTFTYTPSDATMAGPSMVDTFEIYSLNGSYSGSVNGGTVTSWTAGTDFSTTTKTTITCTRGASNVLTVTGNNGFVYGVNAYDSTTPVVQIANCGTGGIASDNNDLLPVVPASGTQTTRIIGRLGLAYLPDCVIYDIGINDAGAGTAAVPYGANITSTVSYLQSKNSDVIFKSMSPTAISVLGGAQLALETAYQLQIKAMCTTLKVPLFDGFARWESYEISSPFGYYNGTIHPTGLGYADLAGGLVSMIRTL